MDKRQEQVQRRHAEYQRLPPWSVAAPLEIKPYPERASHDRHTHDRQRTLGIDCRDEVDETEDGAASRTHTSTLGYNSVKRFVATLKARASERFDVLEFLPGEEAQVDHGQGAPNP